MKSSMQELNMEEMNEVSGGLVWLLVLGGAALLTGCGMGTGGVPGQPETENTTVGKACRKDPNSTACKEAAGKKE